MQNHNFQKAHLQSPGGKQKYHPNGTERNRQPRKKEWCIDATLFALVQTPKTQFSCCFQHVHSFCFAAESDAISGCFLTKNIKRSGKKWKHVYAEGHMESQNCKRQHRL